MACWLTIDKLKLKKHDRLAESRSPCADFVQMQQYCLAQPALVGNKLLSLRSKTGVLCCTITVPNVVL
jgi:hypothetical protein